MTKVFDAAKKRCEEITAQDSLDQANERFDH
jgi:hypothetical protein